MRNLKSIFEYKLKKIYLRLNYEELIVYKSNRFRSNIIYLIVRTDNIFLIYIGNKKKLLLYTNKRLVDNDRNNVRHMMI